MRIEKWSNLFIYNVNKSNYIFTWLTNVTVNLVGVLKSACYCVQVEQLYGDKANTNFRSEKK